MLNDKSIKSNKLINPETVSYTSIFLLSAFLMIIIKQVLKGIFTISSSVALPIAFAVALIIQFLLEKKYTFIHNARTSDLQQGLRFIFRSAVDFGFYRILAFILCDLLKADEMIPFDISLVLIFVFNYYFDRLILFDCASKPENLNSTKLYRLFYKNRFICVSALLSAAVILTVFAIYSLFPFGDFSVLRMDLYHQYGPMFLEFYDRIVNHESFLYTWNSGGSSFLGDYFNYLSSPLSFIIFLFDREQIGDMITTLVIVKGILSSASFTYYLKSSLKEHSYITAAFGTIYAFSGYFLAYYWNIMWIDAMILLPFIALGIERIINEGKGKTYLISLILLFFSNYYMGYMACIFSVVYFFVYYFAKCDIAEKLEGKSNNPIKKFLNIKFINRGLNFAFYSLVAGMICACFLIPVYSILQNCSATSDAFPKTFESYFDILDFFTSHLAGLETTIRSSGDNVLPNVYCSILAVILLPLYFINKNIRLKEKTAYTALLIFFIFSFNNNVANFIWHAFHMPNDLPYRFSYMYVFVFLVMAFKGVQHIGKVKYKDIVYSTLAIIVLIAIMQKFATNKMSEMTIYFSLGACIIWCIALLAIQNSKLSKSIIGLIMMCLIFSESIISGCVSYKFTQPQTPYTENIPNITKAVEYIDENKDGLYRTEQTKLLTRNDPCIYGYDGMSTFSSMAYENFSQCQYSLGMFGNRINSFTYNTQTPVYNMMYGIKYLIDNEKAELSDNYYKLVYTTEDQKQTQVYENKYALPLCFTVPESIKDWDNTEGNPFDVQESLIDNASGVSDVFVPVKYLNTQTESCVCEDITENGLYYISSTGTGSVTVTIETVKDSNVYVYADSKAVSNVTYYFNGGEESVNQSTSTPYIYDLGYHDKGESIRVSLDLAGSDSGDSTLKFYAYNVDNDVLNSAYEMLELGAMNVTNHTDTKIEGTVNAGYNGYIYTSIPYDEAWKVYVDGNETEVQALGKGRGEDSNTDACQLIIPITQGEHEITMKYRPGGIMLGCIISAAGILLLILSYLLKKWVNTHNDGNAK